MADMTPEEARFYLDAYNLELNPTPETDVFRRALATLAAMRVEHDHGVVDWEQVDGRYEVYHRVRLVGEWQDADPAEANAYRTARARAAEATD